MRKKAPLSRATPLVRYESDGMGGSYKTFLMKCQMCFKRTYCFQGVCDNCYDLMESPLPTKKVVMIPVPRKADDGS